MAGMDDHLLKCLLLRSAMIQPVSCAERLELENSFIAWEEVLGNFCGRKMHEPVLQGKEGNTVLKDDPKRLGRKANIKLTRPERILLIDEVRESTSQKQDDRIALRKLVVAKGNQSQERSSYKECHFAVLRCTAVSGEPIMCVVIVGAKINRL
jgi:hypothetical protein